MEEEKMATGMPQSMAAERVYEEPRTRHVHSEIVRMDESVALLDKELGALAEDLVGVLMPRQGDPSADTIPSPVRSPIAENVASITDRVWRLREFVTTLRDRLDI